MRRRDVALALLSALLTCGAHAGAATRLYPAQLCWVPWNEGNVWATSAPEGFLTAEYVAEAGEPNYLYCPIVDDATLFHHNVDELIVWTHSADISAYASASACLDDATSTDSFCEEFVDGNDERVDAAGSFADFDDLLNAEWYAYITVRLFGEIEMVGYETTT